MSDLSAYDIPFNDLEQQVVAWVAEALELRFSPVKGDDPPCLPASESQKPIMDSLLSVRARLDRVEMLLSLVTRAKGRVSRAYQVASSQASDAWDQASVADRSSPVRKGSDFTAPRERYADYSLATMNQQIASRKTFRLLSVAEESLEVVKLCHRGLNDLRQDHLALLRAFSFESHLERATPDRGY